MSVNTTLSRGEIGPSILGFGETVYSSANGMREANPKTLQDNVAAFIYSQNHSTSAVCGTI